jgi:DNA-binding transcriptional MerR regulator
MLISIQEITKTTGIPGTTIRRYIQVFENILPQGTKLGRTKKYPPETGKTLKSIHASYQKGLSTVEIQGKLSDTDTATFKDQTETTTEPPQEIGSLQAVIRELTEAVRTLTEAVKLSSPHHNHIITTEPPLNHDNTTTEPPEHHETRSEPIPPKEPPASTTTTIPPENHDSATIELSNLEPIQIEKVPHSTTKSSQNHNDITTTPELDSLELEGESVEPTQGELALEPESELQADVGPKTLTTEERDAIILKTASMITGFQCGTKRAEALNKAGVTTRQGATWTPKKVSDAIGKAKRRLKK